MEEDETRSRLLNLEVIETENAHTTGQNIRGEPQQGDIDGSIYPVIL